MTAKQRRTHPSLYSHMVDSVSSGEGVGIGIINSIVSAPKSVLESVKVLLSVLALTSSSALASMSVSVPTLLSVSAPG